MASAYVKRTQFRECRFGTRIATCYHQPRCGPERPASYPDGMGRFGRLITGWHGPIRSPRQAEREAACWQGEGWTAEVMPVTPETRALVRAWQKAAKGYPGEVA